MQCCCEKIKRETKLNSASVQSHCCSRTAALQRKKTSACSPFPSPNRAPALSRTAIIIRAKDGCTHTLLHMRRCPHRWVNTFALESRKQACNERGITHDREQTQEQTHARTHMHTYSCQSASLSDARNDSSVISR